MLLNNVCCYEYVEYTDCAASIPRSNAQEDKRTSELECAQTQHPEEAILSEGIILEALQIHSLIIYFLLSNEIWLLEQFSILISKICPTHQGKHRAPGV